MPAVNGVGEPCAGEPHARIEVAAGGNRNQSATAARRVAPPADPTETSARRAPQLTTPPLRRPPRRGGVAEYKERLMAGLRKKSDKVQVTGPLRPRE